MVEGLVLANAAFLTWALIRDARLRTRRIVAGVAVVRWPSSPPKTPGAR